MKINLDLNDEMIESLVKLKQRLGGNITLKDAALHALGVGLNQSVDNEAADISPIFAIAGMNLPLDSLPDGENIKSRKVVVSPKNGDVEAFRDTLNKIFGYGFNISSQDEAGNCMCDSCVAKRLSNKTTKFS